MLSDLYGITKAVLLLLSLTHIVFEKLIQIHCAIRDTGGHTPLTELFERLLQSGACSKMDGCTENGKRYRRVLLWIEPDCSSIHRISEQKG